MASVELCAESVTRQDQGGDMRVVIVGQQAFGKAVLEAFVGRGDTIAGVFAAPEKPGSRPDPLVAAAEERKFPVYRFPKYSAPEALEALKSCNADIGVMAYVLLFAPPEFCAIPKHGMIQFHPSVLPLHRGPASIPWAIIRGRSETGLTIFRPTPGAWTTLKSEAGEQKLYLFDSKKIMAPTFGSVRGKKLGEVVSAGPEGVRIHAQGGFIECSRLRLGDGAKVKPSEIDLPVGTILGA